MRLNGNDETARAYALLVEPPEQFGARAVPLLLLRLVLVIDTVVVRRLVDELGVDEGRTGGPQRHDLVVGAEDALEFRPLAVNGDVVGRCDQHQRRTLRRRRPEHSAARTRRTRCCTNQSLITLFANDFFYLQLSNFTFEFNSLFEFFSFEFFFKAYSCIIFKLN